MGSLIDAILQDNYVLLLIAVCGSCFIGLACLVVALISSVLQINTVMVLLTLIGAAGFSVLIPKVLKYFSTHSGEKVADDDRTKTFQAKEFEDSEDGTPDVGPNGEAGTKLLLTTMEFYLRQVGSPTVASIHSVSRKESSDKSVGQEDPMIEVIDFLTHRAQTILELNPWLAGRFKTKAAEDQDPQLASLYLWVPNRVPKLSSASERLDDEDERRFFRVVKVATRAEATRWDKSLKLSAPNAYTCVNKDISPARVTLVHHSCLRSGTATYSLVLSLNHVLGDAATDYNVLEMFSGATQPRALIAKRQRHWSQLPKTLLGADAQRKTWWWILSSRNGPVQQLLTRKNNRSQLIKMQYQLFDAESSGAPYPEQFRHYAYAYSVDPQWVETQKEAFEIRTANLSATEVAIFQKNAPFVSTNDILCSWIYSNVRPHIAAGFMVYDMRGRHAGVTMDHAGNYGEILGLFPEEFKDPANIRTCVASAGERNIARSPKGELTKPGSGRVTASITNWAQFYRSVKPYPTSSASDWGNKFEGCHLDTLSLVASISRDEIGTPLPLCTMWRRNDKGEIGIFLTCDEPLPKCWCPASNPGKTPFKDVLEYKIPELVATGVHINEFK